MTYLTLKGLLKRANQVKRDNTRHESEERKVSREDRAVRISRNANKPITSRQCKQTNYIAPFGYGAREERGVTM